MSPLSALKKKKKKEGTDGIKTEKKERNGKKKGITLPARSTSTNAEQGSRASTCPVPFSSGGKGEKKGTRCLGGRRKKKKKA